MMKMPFGRGRALEAAAAALGTLALAGRALGGFYVDCAICHQVPQNGMTLVNFQTVTNLGAGARKVFQVTAGQTAVIQLSVTNGYGGNYGLNVNNLGAGGVNDSSDHLACVPDPTWASYFPGTSTNFYLAGCSSTSPEVWTFNLAVKTNTPADFYALNTQMAGYDAASQMWSQQETFYVQVVSPLPPAPAMVAPGRAGSSFSVQVPTAGGFTYYLEFTTNAAGPTWTAVAQVAGDGTSHVLTDTGATGPQRFYHVRVE